MRTSDRVLDFLIDHMGWVILILILIMVLVAVAENKEERAFMKECTKDHKEYECKVMWNQTQPKHTYIYLPN